MFSYEERIKAVNLLIQYDMIYSDVIRELGYPSEKTLRNWYAEYKENDDLHADYIRKYKYTLEQKQLAVTYYLKHGKSVSRTVRKLGFPSRPQLDKWIAEIMPNQKRHCCLGMTVVKYTNEQKVQAVISLCSRSKSAKEVAADYGVTRENLYNWKSQLLKEGCVKNMNNKKIKRYQDTQYIDSEGVQLHTEKDSLIRQIADLQKEVERLKIERDIYEKAAEIIKKDKGINIQSLTNREKAIIINALRDRYKLKDLLKILNMAKSINCYQLIAINTDKYIDLRTKIIEIFNEPQADTDIAGFIRLLNQQEILFPKK